MTVKRNESEATSQPRKRRRLQPSEQNRTTEEERNGSDDSNGQQNQQSDVVSAAKVRVPSIVWKYAHRDCDNPGWAVCKLCPTFPLPKRLSVKDGTTSALRKHLINVHKKEELEPVAKKSQRSISNILPNERDRLHQLLIDAVVVDGRTFSDIRKPGISRFLDEVIPGRVCLCV